jgi:hypothetical protein
MNKKISKQKPKASNFFVMFRNPQGEIPFDQINVPSNTNTQMLQ